MPLDSYETWTLLIAALTAVTCGLCGSLLLLNRQAMVSEGLSHAVLPGLVVAFLLYRDYETPWLMLLAAASGLLMVWITEAISKTQLVDADAGLGIVFAAMFSAGILLVSLKLRNTHFHADCIIDGNLALAPFDRWELPWIGSLPKSFVTLSTLLGVTLLVVIVCYKELKVMIFDPLHALRIGFHPRRLSYLWLSLASLTAVAAFEAAGSVLIVALMIAPPAAAFLLTQRFDRFLWLSVGISVVSTLAGFLLSVALEISPTGPIASASGVIFLLVFVSSPRHGVLAKLIASRRQRGLLRSSLAAEIISGCENATEAPSKLAAIFRISQDSAHEWIESLIDARYVEKRDDRFRLTDTGEASVQECLGDLT